MAPDRMQLHNMCKKGHESFKEYAQRWRDLEAQVAPLMMEKEMITIIVDTLPVFCYEKKWWGIMNKRSPVAMLSCSLIYLIMQW